MNGKLQADTMMNERVGWNSNTCDSSQVSGTFLPLVSNGKPLTFPLNRVEQVLVMHFKQVSIASVAHIDAPHRITSAAIEDQLSATMQRLGIPPGLLENLSGIVARRFWDDGVQPSDVATLAAKKAIEIAGIDPNRLGILVNTSVCRDYLEPSTACLVHGNLQLKSHCLNFDLGNACLGFLNGMDVVGNMIERGQIDYGIIVDGEGSRLPIEKTLERLRSEESDEKSFRDNFATLTLGSGAGAMILGRSDLVQTGHQYRGSVTLAASEHSRLCYGQADKMVTNTKKLLIAGLELAARTWASAQETLGWKAEELDELIVHQVSKVHTEQLANSLRLDLGKIYRLYPEFGNIGPANVPIIMSKALEEGRLKSGFKLGLLGIGSGLNCAMAEVIW
jgi:acyl-CoA:acyl-CoA alkyltransferase